MSQRIKIACSVIAAVLSAWLVKALLFSIYYVPTHSMSPAIKPGSYVLVMKAPYRLHAPKYLPLTNIPFMDVNADGPADFCHNQIVVFEDPAPVPSENGEAPTPLIKRLVALPGDAVAFNKTDYTVYPNGAMRSDSLAADSAHTGRDVVWPIEAGEYFMVGDNLEESIDSRYLGAVADELTIGRAVAKIWPWPPRLLN